MTNSSGKFLKGLMLGSSIIGFGYYLSKNTQLTDQISTKVKDGLNVISENSHGVQDKLTTVYTDTKSSLTQVLSDTKSSLGEGVDKTGRQLNDTFVRLKSAFNAGRDAAKDSLKSTSTEITTSHITTLKDSVEKPLGATEDTSVDNTSILHPGSNNIAQSVGDAGNAFDKTTSGKIGNDRFGSDKLSGI